MSRTCRWRSVGIAALCAAVTIGLQADEPKVEVPSYNTMTDAQETVIGREAASEIEKERKLTFVEVPRVQAYISRVVAQLAAQSRRPQLAYSVKVVDTAIQRAGWSPDGMVDLFKHFGERATGIESLMAIGTSHPAPVDREQQIVNEMKKFPPKDELKQLPKPRSPAA